MSGPEAIQSPRTGRTGGTHPCDCMLSKGCTTRPKRATPASWRRRRTTRSTTRSGTGSTPSPRTSSSISPGPWRPRGGPPTASPRPSSIAGCHHRYKLGQRYAQSHHAAPDTAADTKLAVVTSLDSPALTIDPIHRAFKDPIELSRLAGVPHSTHTFQGSGGWDFARAVAAAPQPAIGVWVHGGPAEIWHLGPTTAPVADAPKLPAEIFRNTLLA